MPKIITRQQPKQYTITLSPREARFILDQMQDRLYAGELRAGSIVRKFAAIMGVAATKPKESNYG